MQKCLHLMTCYRGATLYIFLLKQFKNCHSVKRNRFLNVPEHKCLSAGVSKLYQNTKQT